MLLDKFALRGMMTCAFCASLFVGTSVSATALPQSWNGWKWSRTGNLSINIDSKVSAAWQPYLVKGANAWSVSPVIDYRVTKSSASSSCVGALGKIQACSGNYGATGWLAYTNVWTIGNQIIQGTVQFNDYYFSQPTYNNAAFRQYVACQELGNALGLQDSDRNYGNSNLGSCMDYTNDASGTKGGSNGTLANIAPSTSDLRNLATIYATPDRAQLAQTKPTVGGNAFAVPGAVPEPSSWAMMILGFGFAGAAMRRRSKIAVTFG